MMMLLVGADQNIHSQGGRERTPHHDIASYRLIINRLKEGKIGPKWDKSMTFSHQVQYILA